MVHDGESLSRFLSCPILFAEPDRLVSPPSWHEHIPFAFWIVHALRPKVFVELGTHTGNSYAAFAQAIGTLGLPTASYAVDTWRGDPHTLFYDEAVFTDWSAYHDSRFVGFSSLVRSTFAEAVEYFPDGGIDLLHIDGYHTFEAVAEDFRLWRPKMSNRGVVILHDINVREREFGVWRLWEQLKEQYPSFAFLHGHGLGVLGLGSDLPEPVAWLLSHEPAHAKDVAGIRALFARLGAAIAARYTEQNPPAGIDETGVPTTADTGESPESRADVRYLEARKELADTNVALQRARGRIEDLQAAHDLVARKLIQAGHEAEALRLQVLQDSEAFAELAQRVREADRLREQLESVSTEARATVADVKARALDQIVRFKASRSWRMTAPVRAAAEAARVWRGTIARKAPKKDGPERLFDAAYYLDKYPEVAASGLSPEADYLQGGWREGRDPHPLFQTQFYLEQNPDVAASGLNPLVHFVRFGGAEGRNPHPAFDSSFYLARYPDVAAAHVNPLIHYLTLGAAEHRDPSEGFVTAFYVQENPEAAAAGSNPLVHYVEIGQRSGRRCTPVSVERTTANDLVFEDRQSSYVAYERLRTRERTLQSARIDAIALVPASVIQVPDAKLADTAAALSFAPVSSPLVSIVILALDNVRFTVECLASIIRFTDDVTYEVILVDNASSDATQALVGGVPNLVYLRQETNLGFVAGCNRGADAARGRYLVFLNNDAQATTGWLRALLEPFEDDRVGAVGPKVVFPNGRLQEAGAAINTDGSSSMIGLFDDATLPRYNYVRRVDYVSAVCLAIERDRFREMNGFSTDFAPAYYEDVDLCLRLTKRGLHVVYTPRATVVHHLSVTSDSLDSEFKIRCVTRNQQRLSERHQEYIDALNDVRLIAFYLPQFHPIPENDAWWGPGFTEWRNVTRARPNFVGHYQPRLPADLGFYDLRLAEVYSQQVQLAERYGVGGFCFYYYWFGGRRLLEGPIERLLTTSAPMFPFCLAWANENWTRRWDGREHDILVQQSHGDDDDRAVIGDLLRYLEHPAYIRVNGRPLLVIYQMALFPDIRRTMEIWRNECRRHGLGEIYLAAVESFELSRQSEVARDAGFDATIEFPPHNRGVSRVNPGPLLNPSFRGDVFDYEQTALSYMTERLPAQTRFRAVMPGWDNTARRQDDAVIFTGSTPGAYQAWLESALRQTKEQNFGDERLVFVNAWNEWAEGTYLEPDLRWGHAYLEATRNALDHIRLGL